MRSWIAVVALLALSSPAAAQSTYLGASLVGDVMRFSKAEIDDDLPRGVSEPASIDGEALGFNIRVGRSLGQRWGAEFDFARSGEIENTRRQFAIPAVPRPELPVILPPIPDFEFEIETEHQRTSYAALLWMRQEIGDRIELAYLGGVGFHRAETEQDFEITDTRLIQWARAIAPNYTTIEYNVGPAVGLEADIKIGEHIALTAGVRLHGANVSGRNGWLIRPLAGVRWRF